MTNEISTNLTFRLIMIMQRIMGLYIVHLVFTVKTVKNLKMLPPISYNGSLENLASDLLQPLSL